MKNTLGRCGVVLCLLLAAAALPACGGGGGGGKPPGRFSLIQSIDFDGGANGNDWAAGVALDESGNLYVTGYVTVSGQGANIWLAKYDFNLVLQRSTTLNGPANGDDWGYAIALDGSGSVYVVGYVTEPGQDHNIWLAKYDSNLALQKQITVNGSANSTDEGYGIIFDGGGNLYVAGTVTEAGQGYNIWIAKYDTDLNLLLGTTVNGPGNNTDKGRFLALDASGNLFVSGSVTQAGSGYDIWLGKLDTNLNLLKQTIVAGPTTGEDKGYGILFDDTNNVLYVTGTLTEPAQGYDIWLAEYDINLNLLKSVTLNGPVDGEDASYSMVLDRSRNLYQTGVYTEDRGGSNVWIARYNTNLELHSHTTYDGPANGYDSGLGIVRGLSQDVYVSGFVTEVSGDYNIWLAHYRLSP